jgi:hypothetical protein
MADQDDRINSDHSHFDGMGSKPVLGNYVPSRVLHRGLIS